MVHPNPEEKIFDFVVVGGGLSGLCCALAAARHGVKTALVHNRPVLGGNASSETRMHICGADRHCERRNARETGIIEEILLDNRAVNPNHSFSTLDTVLWEKAAFQRNLILFLNTHMTDANKEGSRVSSISAVQLTTERRFCFKAELFCDATGDATLAHLAGARCRVGREGRGEFGERWAPERPDGHTMGSSLLFRAVDTGLPVPFVKPAWAYSFTEDDLACRDHGEISSGYWWIELGGDGTSTVSDSETLRDELLRTLYGIWDHIKNGGDHGAQNYALEWVGHLPGKRESRRVEGDYMLREGDILAARVFDDAIAYGGWPMDVHAVGGIRSCEEPTRFLGDNDLYTIPYRCVYARDVDNLFVGGRAFSTTHMAFSSVRVMATCAVVGQAIGTAAAIAVREHVGPRGVAAHMRELKAALMRDDCFLPGHVNLHPGDIAPQGAVSASSQTPGGEAALVLNGYMRGIYDDGNAWVSQPGCPQWLALAYDGPVRAAELVLRWDSNLSMELMISLSERVQRSQQPGIPASLVRDYRVELMMGRLTVYRVDVKDNHQRLCRHALPNTQFDGVRITVLATHGDPSVRLFQINLYKSVGFLRQHNKTSIDRTDHQAR